MKVNTSEQNEYTVCCHCTNYKFTVCPWPEKQEKDKKLLAWEMYSYGGWSTYESRQRFMDAIDKSGLK